MAKLLITGKMDKKMLVYPLLRVLSFNGAVLFITDDISYNRLFDGVQSGTYRNITLYVGDDFPKEEPDLYKNILVVTEKLKADDFYKFNAVLLVHGPDYTFLGQDINELMEKVNAENKQEGNIRAVLLSVYPVKAAKNIIVRKPEHFFYVCKVEERRELIPCKDSYIEKILTSTFSAVLNIKPRQFASLVRLNPYDLSKKIIGKRLV